MNREEQIDKEASMYESACLWGDNPNGGVKGAYKLGARWADEHPKEGLWDSEKVCVWLEEHKNDYAFPIYQGEELTDESYVSDCIIKDLRKAMEELI